jgi:hypothetical protein
VSRNSGNIHWRELPRLQKRVESVPEFRHHKFGVFAALVEFGLRVPRNSGNITSFWDIGLGIAAALFANSQP